MEAGKPSLTALAVARYRAEHQVLDRGMLFTDPLALQILGVDADTLKREAREVNRRMRIFVAMRQRFAEDALRDAVEDGATQLVILGAGLDTFAYRNPHAGRLRVFEVDYPATQAWKRERLAAAAIAVPAWLTWVPVDFERSSLRQELSQSGFDANARTFFMWLGVVPYLTEEAIWATLGYIAALPGGAQVVFDYSDPPDSMTGEMREYHDKRARRVAALGERWVTYFEAEPLRSRLIETGFLEVEDLRPGQMVERYFPGRGNTLPRHGAHILRAWTA